MNRTITIGLVLFILLLITFDALQQKFYLDTFDLHPESGVLPLSYLLISHALRWGVWAIVSVPVGVGIWKSLPRNHDPIQKGDLFKISGLILLGLVGSLFFVTILTIYRQNLDLSMEIINELMIYFTYQKSLTFFMASMTLVLIIYNQSRNKTIENQVIEISHLQDSLEEALQINQNEEPLLNIKTGNRVQPVPLRNIIWIQADDYCVKIHTENQSFTLRKSMKKLEDQLSAYGFIRVHRGALLNLDYLHQINFEASKIQLVNTAELPLSKTGAKALKRKLEEASL